MRYGGTRHTIRQSRVLAQYARRQRTLSAFAQRLFQIVVKSLRACRRREPQNL
jgi:hypothetical protein